jgi:protein SCO1
MKTWLALLLVICLGTGAIYTTTEGFRVVTTEGARRLAVAARTPAIGNATVLVPDGAARPLAQGLAQELAQELAADGRMAIVTFFYARCAALCSVQGSELQQMQDQIRRRGLTGKVRLLSISFDAADDDAMLRAYARQMRADPRQWQFARVIGAAARQALLDTVGIVVLPAALGQFQHNAAFHIVDPAGRLLRVIDYDDPEGALALAVAGRGHAGAGVAAKPGRALQ